MTAKRLVKVALILAPVLLLGLGGSALAKYPDHPVELVVAFRAGGSLDTTFRVFSTALGKELGQPVVVANRAGGGGAVGASHLKLAKPDGYSLGANASLAFTLSTNMGKVNYGVNDFDYIASIAQTQPAFVAAPKKGWKTWQDLIKAAKKKGSLSFASQTPWDKMAGKVIGKKEKVSLVAVPTKGGGEMIPALLGGHVDFAWSGGIHYKYVKAGKMVVLAACTPEPLEAFPKVPTLLKLGYDISMDVPFLLVAPKGIPAEVKKTLEQAAQRAFKHKEVQTLIKDRLHMPAVFGNSAQITKRILDSYNAYRKLMGK
ncbi:MAG: tripartite tricarboxylate transporter substrate binding protein [Desulfarculaceae bacterium]|jgi:tripartite-type tricarboxylate transporter receptor subunit TctC